MTNENRETTAALKRILAHFRALRGEAEDASAESTRDTTETKAKNGQDRIALVRVLVAGRTVPEVDEPVPLVLSTRCPQKWVAVDLETADIWIPNEHKDFRWHHINSEALKPLKAAILVAQKRNRDTPA